MKTTTTMLLFLSLILGGVAPAAGPDATKEATYGKAITLKKAVSVSDVMENIDRYDSKEVLVEGTIHDVCQNKGCWLIVTDGKQSMRVTFENYSFFVPKDGHNKKVALQGMVKRATLSQAKARHYNSEEKNPTVKPEEIKGSQNVITMVATGVKIY